MIYNNILETIGKTPIVKLNRIGSDLKCELYVKCEFMNPGGSVKDRIGYNMVAEAEKSGRIKPGDTLIEPSSGNAAIGIALAGSVMGYKVIITMPEKMSQEKQVVLEALGAEIVRTPTEAAWDAPDSHISIAKKIQAETPNSHILDQYANPNNPGAHEHTTAVEIDEEFDDSLKMIVAGVGTGGTITGIAKHFKQARPEVKIVGVDPVGSILGGGTEVGSYLVEGIGYDFIPDVLKNELVDQYIKTEDEPSLRMAKRLIREEGLLCGGSCGAAVWGALQAAKGLGKGDKVLVILPDSVRNYLSKFTSSHWMEQHFGS